MKWEGKEKKWEETCEETGRNGKKWDKPEETGRDREKREETGRSGKTGKMERKKNRIN